MDCEINVDSIRALEEQIREHESTVIKLKRARNSLLNVSKLPPEILGNIFHWNLTLKGDFGGLDKRSHNFLVVCHHWFEVASCTPELWSFRENTPKDWARWCHLSRTAPLDLVFDCDDERYFNTTLRNVLQDRATQDTIRSVHLTSISSSLLDSVIDVLANNSEELRSNSVESFVVRNSGHKPDGVNAFNFFVRRHFPKLRRLDLIDCEIGSWHRLASRTSTLTTLNLDFSLSSLTPTTSQLRALLAYNPALQRVALIKCAIPDDGASSFRVQLRHLKDLHLEGDLRNIIGLLHQLDHPRNMDNLSLTPCGYDLADISQIVGPYLRDHLQHRDGLQNGLNLSISPLYGIRHPCKIILRAGSAGGIDFFPPARIDMDAFITITVLLDERPRADVLEGAALDLITYTPQKEVVCIQVHNIHDLAATEDTFIQFPNLRTLSFDGISLPTVFPVVDVKILPSLEHVLLKRIFVGCSDWTPLTTFLAHRASSGKRLDTLVLTNPPSMCPEVMEHIRSTVRVLNLKIARVHCALL